MQITLAQGNIVSIIICPKIKKVDGHLVKLKGMLTILIIKKNLCLGLECMLKILKANLLSLEATIRLEKLNDSLLALAMEVEVAALVANGLHLVVTKLKKQAGIRVLAWPEIKNLEAIIMVKRLVLAVIKLKGRLAKVVEEEIGLALVA
jgi:hypothetical protein